MWLWGKKQHVAEIKTPKREMGWEGVEIFIQVKPETRDKIPDLIKIQEGLIATIVETLITSIISSPNSNRKR